jgi:hypothetical protein
VCSSQSPDIGILPLLYRLFHTGAKAQGSAAVSDSATSERSAAAAGCRRNGFKREYVKA